MVVVTDGVCAIAVDGKGYGTKPGLTLTLPIGQHNVTCLPAGGTLKSQNAMVAARGKPATVFFSIAGGGSSNPASIKPPVGRPTTK